MLDIKMKKIYLGKFLIDTYLIKNNVHFYKKEVIMRLAY